MTREILFDEVNSTTSESSEATKVSGCDAIGDVLRGSWSHGNWNPDQIVTKNIFGVCVSPSVRDLEHAVTCGISSGHLEWLVTTKTQEVVRIWVFSVILFDGEDVQAVVADTPAIASS